MDSELLLKFIGRFPEYLLALLHTLLCFCFWTTFVETAVHKTQQQKQPTKLLLHLQGYEECSVLRDCHLLGRNFQPYKISGYGIIIKGSREPTCG